LTETDRQLKVSVPALKLCNFLTLQLPVNHKYSVQFNGINERLITKDLLFYSKSKFCMHVRMTKCPGTCTQSVHSILPTNPKPVTHTVLTFCINTLSTGALKLVKVFLDIPLAIVVGTSVAVF